MTKSIFKTTLAAAGLTLGLSSLASAGLLSIDTTGASPAALPLGGAHDVPETKGATGWYNANLYTSAQPLPVYLTFEYLGFEAGWTNEFTVASSQVFLNRSFGGNSASSAGDTAGEYATTGNALVDFAFNVLAGGNAGYGVVNGANNPATMANPANDEGMPNFFLGYADADEDSVYIALDDGGGDANSSPSTFDDDNHDDLVLKVTARVPEPASIALVGLGLAGLGAARRYTKR